MSTFEYNRQKIRQREQDDYVNLTEMARATYTSTFEWMINDKTKIGLKVLQDELKQELILTEGYGSTQNKWVHPIVALAYAKWVGTDFYVWCNQNLVYD